MVKRRNASLELYTGLAVARLVLGSAASGWIVFALALALIVVGFVVFPDLRRPAVVAVIAAALTGGLAVLARRG
jgi:hypothetical protein